jgi:cation diffusion facilitator CzcD-associated flavoprotein CzcO
VSLEWAPISRLTPTGILLDSGKHIELDVIVTAIGFETSAQIALPIRGRDGTSMREYWEAKGGPTAYCGTTVPNFPNLWMILGPNAGAGHVSVLFYEEIQVCHSSYSATFSYCLSLIFEMLSIGGLHNENDYVYRQEKLKCIIRGN